MKLLYPFLALSIVIFLPVLSCKKEPLISLPQKITATIPFENNDIKIEFAADLPSDVADLHFFDASNGIIITQAGEIYKTGNGGINWSLQYAAADSMPLYDLLFTDAAIGYAVGGKDNCIGTGCSLPGGIIVNTTNGGVNWEKVFEKDDVEFVSIAVNEKDELFAACNGSDNQIFKSTDDGNNWESLKVVHVPFNKIVFNNNYGFCTSIVPTLFTSGNDGQTWQNGYTFDQDFLTGDISFKDGVGFCVAGLSSLYKTTDNGNSWVWQRSLYYSGQFTTIHPLTSNSCIAFFRGDYSGGDFGHFYGAFWQTKDGGNNWTGIQFNNTESITCPNFYTSANGYAVAKNKLLKIAVK